MAILDTVEIIKKVLMVIVKIIDYVVELSSKGVK